MHLGKVMRTVAWKLYLKKIFMAWKKALLAFLGLLGTGVLHNLF